jgi:hypothetical protein
MQQMNDWSRLAVDPARCKKLHPFVPHKTMVGRELIADNHNSARDN